MKRIYCIALICIFNLNFQGMEENSFENKIENEINFGNKNLFEKLITIQKIKIPNNIPQKPEYEKNDDNFFQIKERPNLVERIYNNEEENNEDQDFLNNLNGLKNQVFRAQQVQAENRVDQIGNPIELGCCCLVPSSKIEEANNKIQNGNTNIDNANTKIQRLNDKNNQLVNNYNSLFQNREGILTAFDNEINRLKGTRNNALKEKSKLEQEKNNLNTYITQLIEQINSCKEKYRKLGMYDKDLDNYSKTLKKNYEDLLGYFNEATNVAKESAEYLNKLEKNERKNCRDIDSLKVQNTSLNEKIEMLKSDLTSKEKGMGVLNEKLESSNEKNTSLNGKLFSIKIDLEKVKKENQTLNELKIKNEEEIKNSSQKIEGKEEQIKLFKEQIEKLNNRIKELEISEKGLKVEKESIKNENKRLEVDTSSKDKEIENLRKENKLLQEKNLELNNTYNKTIKEINEKNSKFLNLYIKEVQNNNNKHNELFQAITSLNLNWNKSFNTLNDDNKENLENIITLNENFNEKKQEEFNTTINDFIEKQKKMIEEINESNNEKLKEISNYYNTTVMNFEKKYNETLGKIEDQANNYEEAVKKLETNLSADSTNNSTKIIESVFNLTSNINNNFKKTCEELNNQKKQFSDDVKKLENNINNVIKENVNTINSNMNSLNDKTNKNVINKIDDLNKNNMIELGKQANSFKQDLVKKNEEYINSNNNLNTSLSTLKENIGKWSQEKEELKKKIQELEAENKRLKEEKYNLNSELDNKKKEYSFLNEEKENLNSSYKKLQDGIKGIGKELNVEEEKENEENYTSFTLQTTIKNKIKELQEKNKNGEANYIKLKEKNKQLNEENSNLIKEKYKAISDKLTADLQASNKEIELLKMQILDNNIKKQNGINENEINKKIKKLKEDIDEKFKNAQQAASLDNKNKELEKKVSEQEEQLKATALGFDLKEQQEFDNYANKMRQENIRKILNDATIGDTMKKNSDNKNENEILKEEYYLPFIFEDYKINNKWICLKKWSASLYEKKTQKIENEIALKENEIVYDEKLIYKSFDDVLFENLEKSKEFSKIKLKDIAPKKIKIKKQSQNDKKNEKKEEKKEEEFDVKDVDVDSYEGYNIYISGGKEKILLGKQFCEAAVNILKNFPDAELYLLFIKTIDPKTGKSSSIYCYFYLKEIPLQKFMEYCAFVQGCSLGARIQTYGEYLSMYINDIVTGSAAIERNNFKYFTKEDLQSIFSSLFSNRWFKGKDITQAKVDGDFIPKEILSYPELLIKPLNKNEYAASKIIDKGLQHPYIEKEIETKVRIYDKKTVFWYKCDMQDPVTYLLSECIGLGNYGYIGRFYKRDGQGNYYPVALKLTLDSAIHEGGSHDAIMKEIKAGKAAAVMGCNRMIYSNRAGLIELKNSNFVNDINKEDFSNMFLNPLQFIEGKNKMNNEKKEYKQLLLAKQDNEDPSDIFFRNGQIVMNTEKWDKDTLKKAADYNYRINFLEERFKNFYDSEKFKKFHNLMFNEDNKVQNTLLYVMEMDIIDEKDEDIYTETTTEKTKNNEEKEIKEEKIEKNNEENNEQNDNINEENKEININDDIKNTINNIAEYLTAQNKCGVIHGDIKAKNMTKNKFLDFGSFDMVTNYGTNTEFSDVVGTPEYWDLVRIFNKELDLVDPYDLIFKDYQLSDLYASIVALYYYIFKEYPAFATLIIIIKSILKHYINDAQNNEKYCNKGYEKKIEDFIDNFPTGKKLVECTKAFEKDKNLKKQINKGIKDNNVPKEEEEKEEEDKKNLNKFNKYLKEVEDKNYLIKEVKQLRYCIYQIIQHSLLTVDDAKKEVEKGEEGEEVDKNKLFFIMSKDKNFYSKGKDRWQEVNDFSEKVVDKLIGKYEDLRKKELENIEKLTGSEDEKKNMLGRIMYQILQQGTFANSENYPAFKVYKNEHSYNNEAKDKENYRRENLDYRKTKSELINKIRNKEKDIDSFLKDNEAFWEDYKERLSLIEKSYLYTLEPLSIKSLITQQPYYKYEKSFIDTINEEKKGNEEKK